MDCPRCRLKLADAEYEGQQLLFCGTCWGYWLTRVQLDQITSAVAYRFASKEVKAVAGALSAHRDADRQGSESNTMPCPACGVEMEQKRYTPRCPVQIDECGDHGIWLDTGEIKDLQVFIEGSLS